MAILGVLAAIVLTTLNNVQNGAMVVQGVNNHRQVTAAYLMYLGEHNGELWYREPDSIWSNGDGAIFGPQNYPRAPGYICQLLEPYGLARAEWDGWREIPNRGDTVWYNPPSLKNSIVHGHGATYYYYFLGSKKGDTIAGLGGEIAKRPYMRDYLGNYKDSKLIHSTSADAKLVFSYLDGHTEFRKP